MAYNELEHHGILGQKWGVRRFQNEDGSLTPEGKDRYGVGEEKKSNNFSSKGGGGSFATRPTGRKTNTTGKGESIYKRGSGLGTGPVGKDSGSYKIDYTTGKKVAARTQSVNKIKEDYIFPKENNKASSPIDADERKKYFDRRFEMEVAENLGDSKNPYFNSTLKSIYETTDIGEGQLQQALQIVAAQKGWNINELIRTSGSMAETLGYGWLTPELFAEAVTYCYKQDADYYNHTDFSSPETKKLFEKFNKNIKNLIKNLKRKGTPEYKAVQNMVAYQKMFNASQAKVKHFEISYNDLEHYGIPKQKWGERRFQNEDGSLTPAGRIRYGKMKKKAKNRVGEANKAKNKKKESDDNAIKKMSEKNKKEIKERLLNNPNANELYKYRDLFTYDELNNAYNRLVLQNKIRSEIVDKGKIRVKKLLEKADTISKLAVSVSTITEKGYNIYSNSRKIDYLSKNKDKFTAQNKTDVPKQNDKNPGKNKDSE